MCKRVRAWFQPLLFQERGAGLAKGWAAHRVRRVRAKGCFWGKLQGGVNWRQSCWNTSQMLTLTAKTHQTCRPLRADGDTVLDGGTLPMTLLTVSSRLRFNARSRDREANG